MPSPHTSVERALSRYRRLVKPAMLEAFPAAGPAYLYDVASLYPQRGGKGIRAALCLAACRALGGVESQAIDTAACIELFHNAFLIHDDVQDFSDSRRGAPTLQRLYGSGIAVNVGNATNLIALQLIMRHRATLGARLTWLIAQETQTMMRHTLEGQAIELAWIHDNAASLKPIDYMQMCLKKTSWYSFIYPLRMGAIIAGQGVIDRLRFYRLGWYLGAAFQIQDDILNLTGQFARYGKEIGGDIAEGKRTLMLIHSLNHCSRTERATLRSILAKPRSQKQESEKQWVLDLIDRLKAIDFAKRSARQLAGAALMEAASAFRNVRDSPEKQFILDLILYAIERES